MASKGILRRSILGMAGILLGILLTPKMHAHAGSSYKTYLDSMNQGVATLLDPSVVCPSEDAKLSVTSEQDEPAEGEEEESNFVMANVQSALNVRMAPGTDSDKVGLLYRDCGGTVLERGDGWSKIKSGNVVGWCSDEYLFFGEEAENLANDVGTILAVNKTQALRLREEPDAAAQVLSYVAKDEQMEVLYVCEDPTWTFVAYGDFEGYVLSDCVTIVRIVDHGETLEEIAARQKAEREAKQRLITNYGAVSADADSKLLLAALIQCEAGGEPYAGQVAVGAVVMNRVRSGAYPNDIYGVIYASGQFTPALNGKVAQVYASGRIYQSCIDAAGEVLDGYTNIGAATHFRRNNGRDGVVIGNHVFY